MKETIALRIPPSCLKGIEAVMKLRALMLPYPMELTHAQELFIVRRFF